MNVIQNRDVVARGGRSFRRELAVRCFAQTGPPSSCLVAEETRLHQLTAGRWVLEAWNYTEDGVDRWYRNVTSEHASWWLRRNGFEDVAEGWGSSPGFDFESRGTGFVPAGVIAAELLMGFPIELEDVS